MGLLDDYLKFTKDAGETREAFIGIMAALLGKISHEKRAAILRGGIPPLGLLRPEDFPSLLANPEILRLAMDQGIVYLARTGPAGRGKVHYVVGRHGECVCAACAYSCVVVHGMPITGVELQPRGCCELCEDREVYN